MRAAKPKFTKRPEPTDAHREFAAAELSPPASSKCALCDGCDLNCDWCAGTGLFFIPKKTGRLDSEDQNCTAL